MPGASHGKSSRLALAGVLHSLTGCPPDSDTSALRPKYPPHVAAERSGRASGGRSRLRRWVRLCRLSGLLSGGI
eukprot:scaffold26793_cov30-Tisochrysis_lutea.AAC.4